MCGDFSYPVMGNDRIDRLNWMQDEAGNKEILQLIPNITN